MRNVTGRCGRLMMAGILVAGVAACDRPDRSAGEPGPAERAGAQIDQALTRAGEGLNKLGEKTGENLQDLGRRLKDEAREAEQAREQRAQDEQQAQQEQSNGATSGE